MPRLSNRSPCALHCHRHCFSGENGTSTRLPLPRLVARSFVRSFHRLFVDAMDHRGSRVLLRRFDWIESIAVQTSWFSLLPYARLLIGSFCRLISDRSPAAVDDVTRSHSMAHTAFRGAVLRKEAPRSLVAFRCWSLLERSRLYVRSLRSKRAVGCRSDALDTAHIAFLRSFRSTAWSIFYVRVLHRAGDFLWIMPGSSFLDKTRAALCCSMVHTAVVGSAFRCTLHALRTRTHLRLSSRTTAHVYAEALEIVEYAGSVGPQHTHDAVHLHFGSLRFASVGLHRGLHYYCACAPDGLVCTTTAHRSPLCLLLHHLCTQSPL